VDHRLLVSRGDEAEQVGPLEERLADPGDVAVPEDPEAAAEEAASHSVPLDHLGGEEADERLCGGEPFGTFQTACESMLSP
jgi:hypothetical protein